MRAVLKRIGQRKTIARTAGVVAVASLLALLVMIVGPASGFLSKLALWFIFCLAGFHWFFGRVKSLTQTQVRLIDYVYLGVGAAGVYVFAMSYEFRRETYFYSLEQDKFAVDSAAQRKKLIETALEIAQDGCKQTILDLTPAYCEAAKRVKESLAQELTPGRLAFLASTYDEVLKSVVLPDGQKTREYLRLENNTRYVALVAKELEIDRLFIQAIEPLPPDPQSESFGLFTWPFILAFALAIRITRTTAEVFDWTSPPAPPTRLTNELPALPDMDTKPPSWIQRE